MKFILLLLITGLSTKGIAQDTLINIKKISTNFFYEIRYATPNNFIKETLYDCAECLLRPEVAKALSQANEYFCEKGYRIKLYDCYRPLDVQKKMWAKVPKATYVGNPYGKGSVHNKGAAVDITLVTLEGCYVEMGSDYDFFGRAAHIDNYNFSKEILEVRKLLFEGMRKHGFQTIRTEWWHFSYRKSNSYSISNQALPCHE